MESEIIVDVVMRLNGQVKPVAETYADAERKENLKRLISIVGELIGEIEQVASLPENYARFESVGELKKMLSEYSDDLEVQIVSYLGVREDSWAPPEEVIIEDVSQDKTVCDEPVVRILVG